jgi:hypothetical protein
MLAEIFMLSVEADVRSLKALTPRGSDARFVPIELPVISAADDLPRPAAVGVGPRPADDPALHG